MSGLIYGHPRDQQEDRPKHYAQVAGAITAWADSGVDFRHQSSNLIKRRAYRLEPIMPPDLANLFNPLACKADFTYSITPRIIKIQDTDKGKKSVAEDLEAVLLKIEYWHKARLLATASLTRVLKGPSTPSSGKTARVT